jgi:hypothetical protein
MIAFPYAGSQLPLLFTLLFIFGLLRAINEHDPKLNIQAKPLYTTMTFPLISY